MLTIIILAALSVLVGVLVINKLNKTKAKPEVPTLEEEPIGYESGSFASTPVEEQPTVEVKKPKAKKTSAKPKAPKAPKKAKNA